MVNRWTAFVLIAAVFLGVGPAALAQDTARRPEGSTTPDLSGIWMLPRRARLNLRFREEDAPLQRWALEIYQANREGVPDLSQSGLNGLDPEMYCLPDGVPRVYTSPLPIEIVQLPGRIYMLFHSLQNPLPRYIYTDGRGHPEGYPVTVMGHSTGRWDGDTLVVDTTGMDADTWLDSSGTPHSDALRVVERLRRVAQDTLEVDFRFEDPKAFTEPWTGKKVYFLQTDWEYVPGITCEDRFKADYSRKVLRNKKDWSEFESK